MSGTGFTAGPWKVFLVKDGPNKGQLLGVGKVSGEGVTDAHGGLWGSGGEKLANANLIAASPSLYEAAKAFEVPGLDLSNPNLSDDVVVPIDVTLGELRQLAAALQLARGEDRGTGG